MEYNPHSEKMWRYEVECLLKTKALNLQPNGFRTEGDYDRIYLRFQNDDFAMLFGLCIQRNGFPISEREVRTKLHYGIKYWSGAYSLKEHSTTLRNRRTVMLLPQFSFDRFSTGQKSSKDKLTVYMENAANAAKHDGYEPSEVIICCTGGEELYEILAGFVLREQGYILFPEYDYGMVNSLLLERISGVPDMVAVKLGAFQDRLIEQGLMEHGAWFHEIELSAANLLGNSSTAKQNYQIGPEVALAIEVEDTAYEASSGYKQLDDYNASLCFDGGILVCPRREHDLRDEKPDRKNYGVITWDPEGSIFSRDCTIEQLDNQQKNELVQVCKRLIASNIRKDKQY
jgi:hypothetical protein